MQSINFSTHEHKERRTTQPTTNNVRRATLKVVYLIERNIMVKVDYTHTALL